MIDYGRILPPEPRLQADPPRDMKEFREVEETFLTSYGWMDKQEGIARIPIEKAMELTVQDMPEWQALDDAAAPTAAIPPAPAPETSAPEKGEQ